MFKKNWLDFFREQIKIPEWRKNEGSKRSITNFRREPVLRIHETNYFLRVSLAPFDRFSMTRGA
jgi:hypothetical protein